MRLLLDTHVALWAIRDDEKLSAKAHRLISDPENVILVSAASVWEISIKHLLKPADMPLSGADAIGYFRKAGYELIPVSAAHAASVGTLPKVHRDPFDRMLVAQSRAEAAHLLTHDRVMAKYGTWVIPV